MKNKTAWYQIDCAIDLVYENLCFLLSAGMPEMQKNVLEHLIDEFIPYFLREAVDDDVCITLPEKGQ